MRSRVFVWGLLCLAVLFAYLPVAALFVWVRVFPGPRLQYPGVAWMLGVAAPVFMLAVYRMLVAPFFQTEYLVRAMPLRKLVPVIALWALPVASFAYWMGDFRHAVHVMDLTLVLLAGLSIPLILFWRTGERAILSAGLGLSAFLNLFVVDDILGPLSPLWVYAAENAQVYLLRSLGCGLSLCLALFGPLPKSARVPAPAVRSAFAGLLVLSVVCMVLPLFSVAGSPALLPAFNAAGFLGVVYFYGRADSSGTRGFLLVTGILEGALLAQSIFLLLGSDASLSSQLTLFTNVLGIGLTAWEVRRRIRREREGRNFISRVRSAPEHSVGY